MHLETLRTLSGKIAIRKSDNACFEPSFGDDYSEAQAIVDCLSGRTGFYFRRVVPVKLLWMIRWVRTGEVWEPSSGEFEVLDAKHAEDALKGKP